ncbi:hypothetical protein V9T40_009935 [Parthenolecanium corni]|uniref:N-acyl-aliphatic-L-amino acid amidohydrolase n=1 Tax=Parthenolecanium corni TaxID=536013 RepID=A0AAN9Y649_9HEMI
MSLDENESEAISNFRKYLRIPTVHPNINYDECVAFLSNLGHSLGLSVRVILPKPSKPVVVMTLLGINPELPSLLLNSHMDVVPVERKFWKHDPFGAEMDDDGNIYGRGAQDMKCVGIQYIEAIRRCLKNGQKFKRTIHLLYVPDEEVGGADGMGAFIRMDEFKKLNIGCALDESLPSSSEIFVLHYADRTKWHLDISCTGITGHGSLVPDGTAAGKIRYIIDKFLDYRESEKIKLLENPNLTLGDVTTVNLMALEGGIQANVIPSKLSATFVLRIAVDVDLEKLRNMVQKWCEEAGEGVEFNETWVGKNQSVTKLDVKNPWWISFKNTCDKMKLKLKTVVCPARSDSTYLREAGIPAFGFSPMNNTPTLLHDHDEFLNKKIFLNGIHIYSNIITNLANV